MKKRGCAKNRHSLKIYGDRLSGPVTGADIVLHVVVNDTYGHPVLLLRVERGLA